MNTYLTIPMRYLAGRKLRTFLTTLAITFGVAVVFAMNLLLPTLMGALEASELGVTGQVDMTVTSSTGAPFDAAVLDRVGATDGVAAAAPAFQRSVTLPNSTLPPFDVLGLDPTRAETVRFYQVVQGRFLSGDDSRSAVVTQNLAQAIGLKVGDKLEIPTPQGLVGLTVEGIVGGLGTDQMLVPLKTAQELFGAAGQLSAIDVVIVAGADRDSVKQALAAKLGNGFSVGSLAAGNAFSQSLQAALILFNAFGLLTLFMGAFLIFNTFRTVVVERRRDIGMLRSVGATRGTIVRMILVESALQGLIGTVIGLVLGYLLGAAATSGLQSLLDKYMRARLGETNVSVGAIALAATLGIGTTVLAGLLPAISAGKVPVLAALRAQPVEVAQRRANIGAITGAVLIVLGIVGVIVGNSSIALLGSVLILTGLVMTTTLLLKPIASALNPLLKWIFAREGQLAEGNLQRNPSRASITVSALMIALAIIVALFAALSSVQNAYDTKLAESTGADILLLPPNLGVWTSDVGVGQDFEQKFAQIEGVGDWAGMVYAPAKVGDTTIQVMGFDPVVYPKVSGLSFDEGDASAYEELGKGRNAVINGFMSNAIKAKVGDDIAVQTANGVQSYHVVAIGGDYLGAKLDSFYTSKQNVAADFNSTDDIMVMANLKQGADAARVKARIEDLLKEYPQLTLNWGADWRKQSLDLLGQTFVILYITLAALAIPSMLGLINTLAINVLERTREIGVLRAIGATRTQVRRMVVAESLLLGITGAALGMLAGLALGYALTSVITSTVYKVTFSFPLGGMILAAAVSIIMALVASALPARQAAGVKIVQALQYE